MTLRSQKKLKKRKYYQAIKGIPNNICIRKNWDYLCNKCAGTSDEDYDGKLLSDVYWEVLLCIVTAVMRKLKVLMETQMTQAIKNLIKLTNLFLKFAEKHITAKIVARHIKLLIFWLHVWKLRINKLSKTR